MEKVLIVYSSMSGNTMEVAEIIGEQFLRSGVNVDMVRVGVDPIPSPRDYNLMAFGTYTWDKGAVPEEVKEAVYDIGYKPDNVVIFGTGDTQFGGDDLFCRAADKLAKFYETEHPVLKVEQSPEGTQEEAVVSWAGEIIRTFSRDEQKAG